MKLQTLLFLLLLIGCQKPKSEPKTTSIAPKPKTETIAIKEHFLKTDTISITEGETTAKDIYVLANLMEKKADKDSIITAKFRLDFYQNKTKTASSKVTIKNYVNGSEWYASLGLTDESEKNSSFIKVSSGYPACGYMQDNYLYYLKNNDLQLVHQWFSMSDSGWGSWAEFTSSETGKDPEKFYCKTVSFEPDDNDSEDSGIVSYSDSISFSLQGNQWKKELLSVKDKVYFEKKMNFNDFHKQN